MRETPKRGELYRDIDGVEYEILARARHTETYEELVVYIPAGGEGKALACPLTDFMKKVDHNKHPEVKAKYRFEKVESGMAETEITSAPSGIDSAGQQEPVSHVSSNDPQEDSEISPELLRFLDADGPEEKLDVLEKIRTRLTNETIDAIAVSLDTEIRQGDIADRYAELREYLLMTVRFEGSRLRN